MSNAAPSLAAGAPVPREALRAVPALDGVRGLAILAVLAHQLCIDGYPASHAVKLLLLPLQAGWVGVQLFFVLSGFLITGILAETRRADNYWSSFFARRALRIFPVYYLLLAITFVVAPRVAHLSAMTLAQHDSAAFYWAYLSNWTPLAGGGVESLGHCWSLAIEEQFYLLWPLVVRALDERALARLCAGIAVLALIFRTVIRAAGLNPELAYELTPARADALALGALAALVVRRPAWLARVAPLLTDRSIAGSLLLAALSLAAGRVSRTSAITQTAGYTLVAVASALLVIRAALDGARGEGRLAAALSAPWLRRYGKYSYAIYVYHLPLHLIVVRTFVLPRLAGASEAVFLGVQLAYFVAGSLGLLLLGALSYRVVERPFLDLKPFFAARPASP
jgi:peptidoglycan/LPS O-acetylase OafA/YrhL